MISNKKCTTEEFIIKSKSIFGDLYDYSKVDYNGNKVKVELICKEHGSFLVRPDSHLSKRYGCNKCSIKNRVNASRNKNWLNDCIKVHGDRYDYSNVEYINNKKKVEIICKEHGSFFMKLNSHISQRQNCPRCYRVLNTEDFIKKSKKVHNELYDYSKSVYVDAREKVIVTCKLHSDFLISPYCHLQGQGCSRCRISKGELKISKILEDMCINYETQYMFSDCININRLPFDFYLPDKNICIEYDGEQHFRPVDWFGGMVAFNKLKKRDSIKNNYCLKNNIKLIRISFDEYDLIYDIINSNIL